MNNRQEKNLEAKLRRKAFNTEIDKYFLYFLD